MINVLIIILFILAIRQLLVKLNNSFPIVELTIMLYILQYLIAPSFEYAFNTGQTMAVSEGLYMRITFITVIAFILGLFSVKSKFNFKQLRINDNLASLLGRSLIIIGFSSQVAMEFLPDAMKATINFFVLFKTIGVYALIFSNSRLDKVLIAVFFFQIAASSILGAMLIDFIIFALFFAMFFSMRYQITNKMKYSFFIFGFVFITIYQGIKEEYRQVVWQQELSVSQKVALLGTLINPESLISVFSADFQKNESLTQTMHRLNQGWQTSKVYNHVPTQVKFENGKEFMNDILSAFMPRFLWQDKRVVNDYQRFNHYTGYRLNKGTAMSLGVIGDFYLNFGVFGTVIIMFLFGHFIARVKKYFLRKFVQVNPINIIWLPFIFSYLIRPGNEFYMVINHLFKAAIILIIVFKIIYPWIGIQNQKRLKTKN